MIYTSVNQALNYATTGSAAADLAATERVVLHPNIPKLVPTGIRIALKDHQAALLLPRSSMGLKGISLANSVGLIDSDYRGELFAALVNRTKEDYVVNRGDRVAQLLIIQVVTPKWRHVSSTSFEQLTTERGEGGFGSTGV